MFANSIDVHFRHLHTRVTFLTAFCQRSASRTWTRDFDLTWFAEHDPGDLLSHCYPCVFKRLSSDIIHHTTDVCFLPVPARKDAFG